MKTIKKRLGRKNQYARNVRNAKKDMLSDESIDVLKEASIKLYEKHLPEKSARAASRLLLRLIKERDQLIRNRQYSYTYPKDKNNKSIQLTDIVRGDDGRLWRVEGFGIGNHSVLAVGPLREDNTRDYVRLKPEWVEHVGDTAAFSFAQADQDMHAQIIKDYASRGEEMPKRVFRGWHPLD